MKILKGKSTEYLTREFPELAILGVHLWALEYCVSTVGKEEATWEYVQRQQEEEGKKEEQRLWKDNSE